MITSLIHSSSDGAPAAKILRILRKAAEPYMHLWCTPGWSPAFKRQTRAACGC